MKEIELELPPHMVIPRLERELASAKLDANKLALELNGARLDTLCWKTQSEQFEQKLIDATEMMNWQRSAIDKLRERNGNAVEILDSIRALLNGERHPDDAERIVAMINGFLAQVRKP